MFLSRYTLGHVAQRSHKAAAGPRKRGYQATRVKRAHAVGVLARPDLCGIIGGFIHGHDHMEIGSQRGVEFVPLVGPDPTVGQGIVAGKFRSVMFSTAVWTQGWMRNERPTSCSYHGHSRFVAIPICTPAKPPPAWM